MKLLRLGQSELLPFDVLVFFFWRDICVWGKWYWLSIVFLRLTGLFLKRPSIFFCWLFLLCRFIALELQFLILQYFFGCWSFFKIAFQQIFFTSWFVFWPLLATFSSEEMFVDLYFWLFYFLLDWSVDWTIPRNELHQLDVFLQLLLTKFLWFFLWLPL